jgi:Ser/Thr protein kinase RdoA (MazF antagonist)
LNTPFGQHPLAGRFNALDPAMVAAAVEVDGRRTTGRFVVLNSYENRVYELELDDGSRVVGKFYRPGRWSRDALLDEHDFLLDLEEAEVPVAAPLELDDEGETLGELTGEAAGIFYAVYPKTRGRIPQEFDDDQLAQVGEWLARLHDVGAAGTAEHRPILTPATYGRANLAFLLENGVLPDGARDGYAFTVEALCDRIEPLFRDVPTHRIHGDCHPGNLLWTPDGPVFLDFDDMLTGPAVQDVWMLVPSYDAEGDRQRQVLLEGYRAERDFPDEWLRLVEPLRALRFVHYAAWIARRWEDPIFQRTFGHFGTVRYWQQETLDLREQLARLDHAAR